MTSLLATRFALVAITSIQLSGCLAAPAFALSQETQAAENATEPAEQKEPSGRDDETLSCILELVAIMTSSRRDVSTKCQRKLEAMQGRRFDVSPDAGNGDDNNSPPDFQRELDDLSRRDQHDADGADDADDSPGVARDQDLRRAETGDNFLELRNDRETNDNDDVKPNSGNGGQESLNKDLAPSNDQQGARRFLEKVLRTRPGSDDEKAAVAFEDEVRFGEPFVTSLEDIDEDFLVIPLRYLASMLMQLDDPVYEDVPDTRMRDSSAASDMEKFKERGDDSSLEEPRATDDDDVADDELSNIKTDRTNEITKDDLDALYKVELDIAKLNGDLRSLKPAYTLS